MYQKASISLEEAKKLYNLSEEVDIFLLSKFTKDELESKTREEFNKIFKDIIFPLIDYSKMRFLDRNNNISQIPTTRIRLSDSNGKWLFNYDYNHEDPHFHYSYDRIYCLLKKEFNFTEEEIYDFMKTIELVYFDLYNVKPLKQ
jgi:hypothetical protein